ncbi:n-acetylglutamate synthase [Desulfopila sp. IMCC35008]|uniref:n-acetylglutamate synthase n=1 Tax=Desulfopila sp. IMCC35008 TaxID=2653858 RepID=UPI0013D300EA|nr:n-acetylglutamate synthase [Desulfopila sp. IMCC35008]
MKYKLEGKTFQSIENMVNGEVSSDTFFHYHQSGELITADYSGGKIVQGHLLGKMLDNGDLTFSYHHLNTDGELMFGKCTSSLEVLPDGRLKYIEQWQWLTGDRSQGTSQIVEINSKDY